MRAKSGGPAILIFLAGLTLFHPLLAVAESRFLDAAKAAARWLDSVQVKTDAGIAWPSDPGDPASVNASLYSGTPGPILFLLELHAATGDVAALAAAKSGADDLLARIEAESDASLYGGAAGIGFALEEVFKATGEESYRRGVRRALEKIMAGAVRKGAGVEWGPVTDIIGGGAGIGLFLLYAAEELDDPAWLDLAAEAGRRLIELGRPKNGGLDWAMDPGYPRLMPNFAHGTAGVAFFLTRLFEATKRKEFLEAALAGGRYLQSIAETDGDACLIFHHEPDGRDLFYLGWCHGPVGTAQLFHRLAIAADDPAWAGWARKGSRGVSESGIPETRTPGFWNNAGLCCGLAGVADFFLCLHRVGGDPADLAFCDRVTDALLAAASVEDGRMKWVQAEHRVRPDFLVAQTGLMQGAAGIGLYLLRRDGFARGRSPRVVLPDSGFGTEVRR
jgi:lantibiotic modifying enzyme